MSELIAERRKQAQAALKAIPDTIRVGAHDVVIQKRDKFSMGNYLGSYYCDDSVIVLADSLATPQQVVETLVHEVNHAIYKGHALSDSDEEERYVLAMSHGLVQVVRDNPWYPKWIAKWSA